MATGRPPKPLALQVLSAPKKAAAKIRRMRDLQLPVDYVDPEHPPAELPPGVQEIWREQAANLPRKLVGKEAVEMYATYCMAVYQHRQLMHRVVSEPPILEGTVDSQGRRRAPVPNPTWVEYRKVTETIRKLLSEMGLTPTSVYRVRPRQQEQDSEQQSEWKAFG